MADSAAIAAVKLQLADESIDLGITDEVIGSWLDSGLSRTKAILEGWRVIAAKSASTEDVVENSSSRTIRLHDRAMLMIADWQKRSDVEDAQVAVGPPRFVSHKATRV